jgi:hypothetical protein
MKRVNILLLDSYYNMESLISYAFSFSELTRRKLKIIYVFDFEWMMNAYTVGSASVADPTFAHIQTNARNEYIEAAPKLKNIIDQYAKNHPSDVPYETLVSEKNRVDLILEELYHDPDLLLLVSTRQSYSEASGGKIGYPNLIMNLSCPVLVVPDNLQFSVLKNIVYASDLHPRDVDSLRHLAELLQFSGGANIVVLHNEKDFSYEKKLHWKGFMEMARERTGLQTLLPLLKSEKKTLRAIEDYAEEANPDLIVVLKQKKGFFEGIFSTSETKNVLSHFSIPILVYHE